MALEQKPDAIMFPDGYWQMKDRPLELRMKPLNDRLSPFLKVKRATLYPVAGGTSWLATSEGVDRYYDRTLLFPIGHPDEKQPRYDWFFAMEDGKGGLTLVGDAQSWDDGTDRLKVGYLRPDNSAGDPDVQEAQADAMGKKAVEAAAEWRKQLAADPEKAEAIRGRMGLDKPTFARKFGLSEPAAASRPAVAAERGTTVEKQPPEPNRDHPEQPRSKEPTKP
jgi:hypothetical protein